MFADWVLFALLASAVSGFGIIVDKVLLTRHSRDWIYLSAFLGVIGFLPLLLLPLFVNPVVQVSVILFGLLIGVLGRIATFFYMKAISIEEASRVVPLWLIGPVFVLVLEWLFLDEQLFLHHYAGFFAVLFGSLLIMTTKIKGLLRLRPAFYIMMLSNLVFSVSEVVFKYASLSSAFLPLLFWLFAGSALVSVPVIIFKRRQKHELFYRKEKLLFLLPLEVLFFIAALGIYVYAISLGPVSLVSTLGSTDGVFVFVYGIFFTMLAPSIFREAIDKKTLLTKAAAIAIMMAGVFLINGGV